MYKFLIKYFFIIMGSIYVYIGILNVNIKKKAMYIIFAAFSLIISVMTIILMPHILYAELPLWILLTFFFMTIYTGLSIETSLTATIISYCCSYISLVISAIIVSFISVIFKNIFENNIPENIIVSQLITGILQLLLLFLPFRFKRLKDGMPFLFNPRFSTIGMYISMLVLFAAMLLNNGNTSLIYTIPIILVILSSFFIFIWWRRQITKTYIDKLRDNELQQLNDELKNKSEKIIELEAENASLAKIIHKDNKLIPAMELAVKDFITTPDKDTGILLIKELEKLSKERKGILTSVETSHKQLASTKVLSIDSLMKYFQNKAFEYKIDFNLNINGNLKDAIPEVITESDLNTLMADIIDNAIIAVKHNNTHNILVIINNTDCFSFEVFDSGDKFDINVLLNFGLKKITTHSDDSGSGIGLMTTYELISKYHASFVIEEFNMENPMYTKKVSVIFDNKNLYIVKGNRTPEEICTLSERRDLIYYQS